jgi:hypothetical protein
VTGAAPPCIARSGDVQWAVGGHAGQLDPRRDSQLETVVKMEVCDTQLYEQVFDNLQVFPSRDSRCWTAASQSRRTGLCGRAVPWRPWRSSARAAGILACSASRTRSCPKASRSPDSARMPASTSFADWRYQLWNGQPAERRAGDREPPPRPIGGDPFGRTGVPRTPGGVCSPPRRSSSTSVARPDSATTMPSSPRPWENSTSRNGLL